MVKKILWYKTRDEAMQNAIRLTVRNRHKLIGNPRRVDGGYEIVMQAPKKIVRKVKEPGWKSTLRNMHGYVWR